MIVKKVHASQTCAVCERTLLLGEKTVRFSTDSGGEWVDVCALCTDEAYEHGWVREGSPSVPVVAAGQRKRRRLAGLSSLFEARRTDAEPEVDEPMLRRLSQPEQAMLHAADQFNGSPYRRTVAGIAKSLGDPRVALLPLSGTNLEVVVTVAWEISWYQYRVMLGTSQPVRLAERGYEIDDLDERFQAWNASLDSAGRIVPDIPRI
jgi:hypothetical protein